jgi:hypothetical protein
METRKTKFKIGDNLYYLRNGEIGYDRVTGEKYHMERKMDVIFGEGISPMYSDNKIEKNYYLFGEIISVEEKFCALTKKELLKSLQDGNK